METRPMAIIIQDIFVIRDKVANQLMEGAKGQLAFNTKGHARKSLVHTGWWPWFKKYDTVRKLMPNGNQAVDEYENLRELMAKEDYRNRDIVLRDALRHADSDISSWIRSNQKAFLAAVAKIKFDNQTRYVVESLVSIETKEIT